MTKHLFFRVLLFSFLLIFSSCSEDDVEVGSNVNPEVLPQPLSPPEEIQNIQNEAIAKVITPSEITASVLISVKDELGASVNGAKVTIAGETMISDNGIVVFRQIELNKDFTGIKVSHPNFITSIKNFTPTESNIYNIDVVLFEGELESFSSSSGANLQFDSGVILDFQPNSFVNADGSIYDGNVSVNTYYHNTTDSDYLLAQPGALVGLDGDQLSALATEGMITVDLTSASGNEVFIKEGESVKVTMPADADAPATIDLWHLNEKHGIWVKTGVATKKGAVYEFEVTHFSTYNLDVKVDSLEEVNFVVKNPDLLGIANQSFEVSIDGIATALVQTDNQANFTLLNAPIGEYKLKITLCDSNDVIMSNTVAVTAVGDYEFVIEASVGARSLNSISFEGNVVNCENQFDDSDILTLTLFKGTANEKTIITRFIDVFFYAQTFICSDIPFEDSIDIEFNYNQGEYIGIKTLSRITFGIDRFRYALSRERVESICDLSGGEAVDLGASVERIIKDSFGFTDDQVLNTAFTEQVKVLNLFPSDSFLLSQLELNTVDLEAIARYFPNLEELRLSVGSNNTVGSLLNFDQIASLNNLNSLSVVGGQITDLSVLNSLTNLRSLTLVDNDITDVSVLSNLSGLEEIRISNNQDITDFSFLDDLVNLHTIELTTMNITDISFLILNNELLFLRLDNNSIEDISSLSGLDNLELLTLSNNNITDISSLPVLSNLDFLTLSDNNISDISGLSGLDNLENLNLRNNRITDISPLINLTGLQSVTLFGNGLEQNDVDELRRQLPNTSVRFF